MAEQTDSTNTSPPVYDARQSEAFRGLESAIGDLRDMCALMEIALQDTLWKPSDILEDELKRAAPWVDGYKVSVLTKDQSIGLDYALRHTRNLINDLHREYYRGFNEKVA